MTTQVSTKVRLVRCPGCRKVLVELPEVPVYKCGGCGTILQAKARKLETKNTELSSQETDSVPESLQEARSSDHDLNGSPKVESSPDKDNVRCQEEHDDRMELSQDRSVSDGLSSSPDVTCTQSEVSPIEVKGSSEYNTLNQNSEGYQSKLRDVDGEQAAYNFSNELPSSAEITLEDEAYPPEAIERVEQHDHSHVHQDNRVDEKEDGESQRVWKEDNDLVHEVQNSPQHDDHENVLPERMKDNHVPPENDEKSRTCSADQNGELNGGIKRDGLAREDDIISRSAEHIDDGFEGLPTFGSSSREKYMTPRNGSLVSFYLTSDDEHLDHSAGQVAHNFERVNSVDTLGSSHPADLSPEHNFKHGSMTNYPTNGSYYAYDGSESSYDGTDDQIFEHISHPSRKHNKDVGYIRSTEVLRKNGFREDNVVNSESERTYWATGSSHHAMKSSHWNRGKSTETNRYITGHKMRLDKQGDISGLPSTSRDHVAGRKVVGTSRYRHDLLPPRPGLNLSGKPSCSESDKADLFRTVCELQDQLNRMRFSKVKSNRRFSDGIMDGKFAPFQYDRLAPESEMYAELSHPSGYSPRHDRAKACARRCNVSRLAFSGEAAHYGHQVTCSCLHCCPQDWHYSAQLPSRSVLCKNCHRVVHTDHSCCNISNSPSPRHYTSSELSLWGCETKSDNQRLDEAKRLHLREKLRTAKRHLRPVAGGAPLVACYHCSELLQLPADFLLFKKRYHRLMCNACRKVLRFSLLKGNRIVPYEPDASAPPPSEADNYSDAIRRRNPSSHSLSCQHVEPVSCSDDYGQSFCRSCSTEGEASVMLPSSYQLEKNSYNRKMSSRGESYEPVVDRKMKGILKSEDSPKSVESVGPSSNMPNWIKVTSEIEELPPSPSSNSPLHRLMGYSSPSLVLNR